jgi:hypothetical protein
VTSGSKNPSKPGGKGKAQSAKRRRSTHVVHPACDVRITLTSRQVAEVLREASAGPNVEGLLSGVGDVEAVRGALAQIDDPRCSRSTLRAVLVLAAFPADGSEMDLRDIADRLGFSPSTTHRYVCSWLAVGLLTQDQHSRRYRRAHPAHAVDVL